MGLNERRRIAAIQEESSQATSELSKIIGFDLPISFDASTLPENEGVLNSYDSYKEYGLPMVIKIFSQICIDDLGKNAVKEKIAAIKLINTSKNVDDAGEKSLTIENGELLIKMSFYYYSDKLWGEEELRKAIENLL